MDDSESSSRLESDHVEFHQLAEGRAVTPEQTACAPKAQPRPGVWRYSWYVVVLVGPLLVAWFLPHAVQLWLRNWSTTVALVLAVINLGVEHVALRSGATLKLISACARSLAVLLVLVSGLSTVADLRIRAYAPVEAIHGNVTVTLDRAVSVHVPPPGLGVGMIREPGGRGYRWWVPIQKSSRKEVKRGSSVVTQIHVEFSNDGVHRCPYLSELSATEFPSQIHYLVPGVFITADLGVRAVRTKAIVVLNGTHEYIQEWEYSLPPPDPKYVQEVLASMINPRYIQLGKPR